MQTENNGGTASVVSEAGTHRDHILKDSMILFIATVLMNGFKFLYHMYTSRVLGPEKYGILVTFLGLLIILTIPALSLQMTISKKTTRFKTQGKLGSVRALFFSTSRWFLLLGIGACIILLILQKPLCTFFHINDPFFVIILAVIVIINLLLPVVKGILQGMQRFISFGAVISSDAILKVFYVFVLFKLGIMLRGALSSNLISIGSVYIISTGLLLYFLTKKAPQPQAEDTSISKKEIFGYALPVFASMLGFSLLGYLDVLLVKHFFNDYNAGLYSATSIVGKAFLFFPDAIAMVLFPKVSEKFELKLDTRSLLLKGLALTFGISLTGVAFCWFFPRLVITILFGEKFLGVAPIVQYFGLAILPLVLLNVIIQYSLAVHRYVFLIFMYMGIILYVFLLWFFHDTFFHVLRALFFSNLFILMMSVIFLMIKKRNAP
ncbi:oligosaccharide flippase family protein [Spirochaetota bacterium]